MSPEQSDLNGTGGRHRTRSAAPHLMLAMAEQFAVSVTHFLDDNGELHRSARSKDAASPQLVAWRKLFHLIAYLMAEGYVLGNEDSE